MDLLESGDERDRPAAADLLRRGLALSLPRWALAALAAVVAVTLVGGVVGAVQVGSAIEREAARPRVDVLPAEGTSSTVAGVARGRIGLLLVNRRPRPAQLQELEVSVEGLRVLRVEPELDRPLGPLEQRRVRISYVIPSCDALVLPGTVSVAVTAVGQAVRRTQLPVHDGSAAEEGEGLGLRACPPSARGTAAGTPTDIGVRPAGGESRRVGAGAEGFVRLEIRNDGAPVQLISVGGRVPGVAFAPGRCAADGPSRPTV